MGRDNMFPFQTMSPFPIFLWDVIILRKDLFVGSEWAIAIEGGFVIPAYLSQEDLFGFAERLNGCVTPVSGVNGAGE